MPTLAHNLEIKARCQDLAEARLAVQRLCGGDGVVELQTDTYFQVPHGRLKLREIESKPAVLIWYERPNHAETRDSAYHLVPVADAAMLKAALTAALGVRGAVRKRREIFLWHNVRIHLDEVDGLGSFIEFEAVLSAGEDVETSRSRLRQLVAVLSIQPEDQLAPSYADLLKI